MTTDDYITTTGERWNISLRGSRSEPPICIRDTDGDEVGYRDLRTRQGREFEVLCQVREHRGFSVFWATEFATRAHAIDRLQARRCIQPIEGGTFPWCRYRIAKKEALGE